MMSHYNSHRAVFRDQFTFCHQPQQFHEPQLTSCRGQDYTRQHQQHVQHLHQHQQQHQEQYRHQQRREQCPQSFTSSQNTAFNHTTPGLYQAAPSLYPNGSVLRQNATPFQTLPFLLPTPQDLRFSKAPANSTAPNSHTVQAREFEKWQNHDYSQGSVFGDGSQCIVQHQRRCEQKQINFTSCDDPKNQAGSEVCQSMLNTPRGLHATKNETHGSLNMKPRGQVWTDHHTGHLQQGAPQSRPGFQDGGPEFKNKRQRRTYPKQTGHIGDVSSAKGGNKKDRQKQLAKEIFDSEMRQKMVTMFPNLPTITTHFPPQRFNKTLTTWDRARGLHVQHESSVSDLGCDRAERDVRRCLEQIRETTRQPMCVIFNYAFDSYLEKKFKTPSRKERSFDSPQPNQLPSAKQYVRCERVTNKQDKNMEISSGSPASNAATTLNTTLSLSPCPALNPQIELNCLTKSSCTSKNKPASTPLSQEMDSSRMDNDVERNSSAAATFLDHDKHGGSAGPCTNMTSAIPDMTDKSYSRLSSSAVLQSPPAVPASPNIRSPKFDPRKQFSKPRALFPSPDDLDKELKRGDFDALIINQGQGCIIIETKAVGYIQEFDLEVVRKKVEQAVQQLHKGEVILQHVFSDLTDEFPVTKVLAMPNVSREDLKSACSGDADFKQMVCECFSAKSLEEAVHKVLCADDIVRDGVQSLTTSERKTTEHESLMLWWEHVTGGDNSVQREVTDGEKDATELCQRLPRHVFEQMVARLAGPYSKVTVESTRDAAEARTVADCVHLTGVRYGRSLLRQDQLEILDSQDQFVYLSGPPGSGKTLVLGLKGVEWAKKGDHVVVFVPQGVGWGSLISQTLYHRIGEFAAASQSRKQSRSTAKKTRHEKEFYQEQPDSVSGVTDQNIDHIHHREWTSSESDTSESLSYKTESSLKLRNSCSSEDCPSDCSSSDVNFAPQVHVATVDKTQDTELFVRDLLARYSDRPLRIIVDEGPTKVDIMWLLKLLCKAHEILNAARQDFESFVEHPMDCGVSGEWIGLYWLSSESPRSKQEGDTNTAGTVKALIAKVRHHMQTISNRLQILQPSHGKPQVTQSAQWRSHVSDIASVHLDMSRLLDVLDERLVSPPNISSVNEEQAETNVLYKRDPCVSGNLSCQQDTPTQVSIKPSVNIDGESGENGCDTDTGRDPDSRATYEKVEQSAPNSAGGGVTGDTVQKSEVSTGTQESPAKPTEKLTAALDKLEAEMLDVSGKLFNVETLMDFFVVSEICSLLVKERGSKELSVWSSGVSHFYRPQDFVHKTLTHCLRCPPTVQRVLALVEKDMADCLNYQYQVDSLRDDHFPLPTDGPEVKLLDHGSHMEKTKDILDCRHCGEMLVEYLLHTLHIGGDGGLQAHDVNISGSLDINNVQGRPFLQALLDQGIEIQFEQQGVTSPPPYPGKMFAIGGCSFQGLESKVVVFIPDVSRIPSDTSDVVQFRPQLPEWLKKMGRWNRCHLWFVASRCLSQLVAFHV